MAARYNTLHYHKPAMKPQDDYRIALHSVACPKLLPKYFNNMQPKGGLNKELLDYKRIQEELIERYSKMRRITRGELERSGLRKDKTLVSAMRRRSSSEDDFNSSLRRSGFLSSNLMKLYSELDEKYTTKNIYEHFCRLLY